MACVLLHNANSLWPEYQRKKGVTAGEMRQPEPIRAFRFVTWRSDTGGLSTSAVTTSPLPCGHCVRIELASPTWPGCRGWSELNRRIARINGKFSYNFGNATGILVREVSSRPAHHAVTSGRGSSPPTSDWYLLHEGWQKAHPGIRLAAQPRSA